MQIQKIDYTNLKGKSRAIELAAMNVITGDNDAGKSTVRDAILLGLLGEHPLVGKTNQGVFRMSSGSEMTVRLTLPNANIERSWKQKGKKVSATAIGLDQIPPVPIIMLNADEFRAATDAKRLNAIFELAKVEVNVAEIQKRATKAAEDQGVAITAHYFTSEDKDQAREEAENPQKWIDGTIERFSEAMKAKRAEIKRLEQTAQGLAQMAATDDAVNPASVAAAIAAAESTIKGLESAIATLQADYQHAQKAKAAREKWEKDVAAKRALAAEAPTDHTAAQIAALGQEVKKERDAIVEKHSAAKHAWNIESDTRQRIKSEQTEIARLENLVATLPTEEEKAKALQATIDGLENGAEAAQMTIEDLTREEQGIMREEAAVNAMEADLNKRTAEFESLKQASCCPTCSAPSDTWKDALLERLANEIAKARIERDTAIKELNERLGSVQERKKKIQDAAQEQSRSLQAKRITLGETKEKIATMRENAKQLDAAKTKLEGLKAKSNTELKEPAEPDLSEIDKRLEELRDTWAACDARETLAFLESNAPTAADPDAIEAARQAKVAELEKARQDRAALAQQEQAVANQSNEARRLQQAQDDRTAAEKELNGLKAAANTLDAEKADLSEKAFKPLLKTVEQFTAGIFPTPIEMHEGQIGRFNAGSFVPLDLFGGAFMAVAIAGLQAALGAQSPSRIVITDELDRFDAKNKPKFLANIAAAIEAGTIEQFIGMDPKPEDYDGLQINGLRIEKLTGN